jgi:hypothetical protein
LERESFIAAGFLPREVSTVARPRLLWVDIGMAVIAGVFLAMVIFLRKEDFFLPLLAAYALVVMVWALVAERAAVSAERKEFVSYEDQWSERDRPGP